MSKKSFGKNDEKSNSMSRPETSRPNSTLTASGSATGNPRNKVALTPGHSLMDWIRLGHSGKDLTGVNGVLQSVSLEELAKHNQPTDCWLAIRGTVFNVTHYMDFHPGGNEELIKGAGKDATALFDEVHAYVNYTSILQKCIVGRLQQSSNSNAAKPSSIDLKTQKRLKQQSPEFKQPRQLPSLKPVPSSALDKKEGSFLLPLDWYQQEDSINIVFYTKVPYCPQVQILLYNNDLTVFTKLKDKVIRSNLTLSGAVKWPGKVLINDRGKIVIEFNKLERGQWTTYGTPCVASVLTQFDDKPKRIAKVVDSVTVTHNTRLVILRYDEQFYNSVPIGHHLLVHYNVEGCDLVRMYTPVPPWLHPDFVLPNWTTDCVCLMVKHYPAGSVTPWLCGLKTGDLVKLSGPEGIFSVQALKDCTHLYLVAAGTGVTPMLGLIQWALGNTTSKCKKVSLLFFNKTSSDILWGSQMETLMHSDERFSAQHVLSEAEPGWTGHRGHVDLDLLKSFFPDPTAEPNPDASCFICVCGPTRFTQITRELTVSLGFSDNQFHCFVG